MTEDKICPFMSRPIYVDCIKDVKLVKMFCCGEDCMAWQAVGGTYGNPIYGCVRLQQ